MLYFTGLKKQKDSAIAIKNRYQLDCFKAEDGTLYPLNFSQLPFTPKRFFMVSGCEVNEKRGNHAHYLCKTFLFCASGAIDITLNDGINEYTHDLKKGEGVFVDRLVWDYQVYKEKDSILIAFCSIEYEPNDYIEDFEQFKKIIQLPK